MNEKQGDSSKSAPALRPRRAPASFDLAPGGAAASEAEASNTRRAARPDAATARKPASLTAAAITIADDHFAAPAAIDQEVAGPMPDAARRLPLGAMLASLAGGLFLLWLSTAAYGWISGLLLAYPPLGWAAAVLAGLCVLVFLAIIARELAGMARLGANTRIRAEFERAIATGDATAARSAVDSLETVLRRVPEAAAGLAAFKRVDRKFLAPADLAGLAERDLLANLDARAVAEVTAAAKRVSIVTAVSPRAFIDVGYVLYENLRLIARIAGIYGCRPGPVGFMRLLRRTLAHLAVTGVVAMGDTLVQQLVGHGLAARVSARLGEGVLNGVLTARIGLAAMDVARPAPFNALPRPAIGDVVSALKPGRASGS
jgi:putative membrane protein